MKYLKFKDAVRKFPFITTTHIFNLDKNPHTLIVQLKGWERKNLVIKLKRGFYLLSESERKIEPSRIFLANSLYSPSYVSTLYALYYYDLIPEKVEDVTSVTTKKTTKFITPLGTFVYQHLKTDLFFGLRKIEDENGFPVFIAEPEKALLDFFYLNLKDFKGKNKDIFSLSYRFQNLSLLGEKKLLRFAKRYKNQNIIEVIKKFLDFMKNA